MKSSTTTKLVDKKTTFAVLSDPRYAHLFTSVQRGCARSHVPWTRRVAATKTIFRDREWDLPDLACHHRELFVLKPNDDYSGHGVLTGEETDGPTWEQAITDALKGQFVLQELVPATKINMPSYDGKLEWKEMTVDFGPFVFRTEVEGGLIRLSSSAMCNGSSGGGVTALLVFETALVVVEES